MEKIQFYYEYFKQHPETKLETRDGDEVRFIGEASICEEEDSKLIFETKHEILRTFVNGTYVRIGESDEDIFMLLKFKETVVYANVTDNGVFFVYSSLKAAIYNCSINAKSVAKLTIVDGEIVKTETVHKY